MPRKIEPFKIQESSYSNVMFGFDRNEPIEEVVAPKVTGSSEPSVPELLPTGAPSLPPQTPSSEEKEGATKESSSVPTVPSSESAETTETSLDSSSASGAAKTSTTATSGARSSATKAPVPTLTAAPIVPTSKRS